MLIPIDINQTLSTIYFVLLFSALPLIAIQWYSMVVSSRGVVGTVNPKKKSTRIIFLIATKYCPDFVQETVNSIYNSCRTSGFTNYQINVLTELPKKLKHATTIIIPKDYVCNAHMKARGLSYNLRYLPNSKDVWVFHLDEDSLVIPQTINAICDFINKEPVHHKLLANGLSVFTENGNNFMFYAEVQRLWTFLWLKFQLQRSPLWMNGSNMLVRSDLEHEVGWEHGNIYSEDTSFAYYAKRMRGNIFGWHGGLTIEKPPTNMANLIKQRKRWFFGSLLYFWHCPNSMKPLRIYSSIEWVFSFYISLFFFLFIFNVISFSAPLVSYVLLCTLLFWLGKYQYGLYLIFKYNGQEGTARHRTLQYISVLLLTPVIELYCALPTVSALINPPRTFEITDKE